MRILTRSEKETAAFAKKFARTLKGGETILLIGDLGAGKTTFTRALARALGIKSKIKSPTFVLMHQHRIRNPRTKASLGRGRQESGIRNFVHVDAYRVKNARALKDIGLMDYAYRPDTVVVVEWGEKIKSLLKERAYRTITFTHGVVNDTRTIAITKTA